MPKYRVRGWMERVHYYDEIVEGDSEKDARNRFINDVESGLISATEIYTNCAELDFVETNDYSKVEIYADYEIKENDDNAS